MFSKFLFAIWLHHVHLWVWSQTMNPTLFDSPVLSSTSDTFGALQTLQFFRRCQFTLLHRPQIQSSALKHWIAKSVQFPNLTANFIACDSEYDLLEKAAWFFSCRFSNFSAILFPSSWIRCTLFTTSIALCSTSEIQIFTAENNTKPKTTKLRWAQWKWVTFVYGIDNTLVVLVKW